jgi:hexosaminidase
MKTFFSLVVLVSVLQVSFASLKTLPIWPLPASAVTGDDTWTLDGSFTIVYKGTNKIAIDGVNRYLNLIGVNNSSVGNLKSCELTIADDKALPVITDVTDDYKVVVGGTMSPCYISSSYVWGALRALETFTQLMYRDTATNTVKIDGVPLAVNDHTRFNHRGILIDTARHYQPVDEILKIIDSLPVNK